MRTETQNGRGWGGLNGIGCVGSLFLFVVMAAIMGSLRGSAEAEPAAELVMPAATTAAPTHTATHTPTAVPTDTPTNTPEPTDTATAVPTDTATPTLPPTFTPVPLPNDTPTATAVPTATPTPIPLPTPQGVYSWTLKVPILMYHYISVPPEGADKYRIDLSVSPDHFREQMAYLAANGFTTIDLYDLSRAITNKQELPEKPVIITIDDGYRDNYVNAFPVLQEFGQTATISLATQFLDDGHPDYLTWAMVEEMAAAGIRFEPHTKTHPDLRGQSRDYLIYQVLGSRETIAAHVGYMPRFFTYPSGRYDEGTIQILQELDFWGALTTWSGKWHGFDDRYEWTRLRVRNNTYLPEFIDLVDPGDTYRGKPVE
ncbi:MAG: polysaccharide deacetylase family protein [Anaerolineae bacterium]